MELSIIKPHILCLVQSSNYKLERKIYKTPPCTDMITQRMDLSTKRRLSMSVEKFKISKENSTYTIASNKVIDGLKFDLELLGLYIYLLSLPPEWVFYKSYLTQTCRVGAKKLNRLLNSLVQFNLISTVQNRDEKGRFVHTDLCIKNGESFKIIELEEVHRKAKTGRTETGRTETDNYKVNSKKENINKINTEKLLSASCDAQLGFDDFWINYPVKRNKIRAERIWIKEKCVLIKEKIVLDLKERKLKDQQWQDNQFIPHPATYLKNHLWNDEIILLASTQRSTQVKNETKSTVKFIDDPSHPSHEIFKSNARPLTVEEIYRNTK